MKATTTKKVLKYFLTVYTNLICRNSFNVNKPFVCWFPRLNCCLNIALLVCAAKHSNSDSANDKSLDVGQPGFWPMSDGKEIKTVRFLHFHLVKPMVQYTSPLGSHVTYQLLKYAITICVSSGLSFTSGQLTHVKAPSITYVLHIKPFRPGLLYLNSFVVFENVKLFIYLETP